MHKLCAIDGISEPGSKGFDHSPKGPVFVVRYDGQIFVYANNCPHLGVNLEWEPDRFLDKEDRLIQCCMHGALFRIEDGECLSGPCVGDSLTPVPHEIKDNTIYLFD
ncbi:Rieske (2Fe-2S) protein [Sansalvadorimonas sp. 2012CJ34-2]|uniref:Rieske (2Fe-2S) protein n=1 Tax=Parendozoicomonas callyspongiae TaxID=2942213 RepID=A0ABT0PM07_9GAMM|nr:Rieske (2Fe-2S) protein [Sansalvadorimonas sp. 2012CJ34-2]MCL6271762.1 Rieske (2Fe-2S) protein [Sansalvadorimonas sp. 2012CJ34-2]